MSVACQIVTRASPTDSCFETITVTENVISENAAIGISADTQAVRVDDVQLNHMVYASNYVEIVFLSPTLPKRRRERLPIARWASWVNSNHRIAVRCKELRLKRKPMIKLAYWPTVY